MDSGEKHAKGSYSTAQNLSIRARIALKKNESEESLALAERAVTLCPIPAILCVRAAALISNGNLDAAEKDLIQAAILDSYNAEVHWRKGQLLEKRGYKEQAAEYKRQALEWHYKPDF